MTRVSITEGTLAELADSIRTVVGSQQTATRKGVLQRIHPTVTLVGILGLVVLAAGSNDPTVMIGLLTLSILFAVSSRVSLRVHALKVLVPMGFALVVVIPHAFLMDGPSLYGLPVTTAGLTYVGTFGLRVGTCVSLVGLIPATTRFADIVEALRGVGVPPVFLSVFALTHRYLVVTAGELSRIALGYRSRRIRQPTYRQAWRGSASMLGMFLLRVFERGERVERAARARGGVHSRSYPSDHTIGVFDVGFVVLVVAVVGIGVGGL